MRPELVLALSSALFKSYFRSSRNPSLTFFSQPRAMLAIDVSLFAVPALIIQSVLASLPQSIIAIAGLLAVSAMISLPVLMTSAVIVSGLMFELAQGSALSSSEAVNWLPISPREYVAASALSTASLDSAFLALATGITLPLTTRLGLLNLWPATLLLSLISLLLGAFIIEFLKAITNRVSSTVYKRSGRVALATRLITLVFLFSVIQLAFQPYFLYWIFGGIAGGIDIAWMIPFLWPSAAMASLSRSNLFQTILFTALSSLLVLTTYEIASQLRQRYWSPVPISISMDVSREYLPQSTRRLGFGFDSVASLLALKEFRSLTRRKDLARFIAIPIVTSLSLILPVLSSPRDMSGRAPGFFLAAMMPFMIPLMLSSISIGQEGNSIMNLLCLPVKPTDLIKGKLAPAWLISVLATTGVIAGMEILAPLGLTNALATMAVATVTIIVNSFIGLGVGSRWPDYTISSRSRYVTMKGFIIGFLLSGLTTLITFAPMSSYVIAGSSGLFPMLVASILLGSMLTVISYIFCKRGVENLLSNL